MATLKNYIESLFKLSGSQAMPRHTGKLSLDLTHDGTFTSPANGFLVLGSKPSDNTPPHINVWGTLHASCTGEDARDARLFVPMAKGDTIYFGSDFEYDISEFIYLVGGGNLAYLWMEGLSCLKLSLRHFSTSLTRVLSLLHRQSKLRLLMALGMKRSHLATVTQCSLAPRAIRGILKSLTTTLGLTAKAQIRHTGTQITCRLRKAVNSIIGYLTQAAVRQFKFATFLLPARLSLALGGAL